MHGLLFLGSEIAVEGVDDELCVIPPYSATCMFSLVLHCHDLYMPPYVLVVIDPCSRVFLLSSCLDKVSLHAFCSIVVALPIVSDGFFSGKYEAGKRYVDRTFESSNKIPDS